MWRNNKDLGLNENHSPSRARPRAFCEDCNGSGIGDGYYCHTCYGTGMTHELNDEWLKPVKGGDNNTSEGFLVPINRIMKEIPI